MMTQMMGGRMMMSNQSELRRQAELKAQRAREAVLGAGDFHKMLKKGVPTGTTEARIEGRTEEALTQNR